MNNDYTEPVLDLERIFNLFVEEVKRRLKVIHLQRIVSTDKFFNFYDTISQHFVEEFIFYLIDQNMLKFDYNDIHDDITVTISINTRNHEDANIYNLSIIDKAYNMSCLFEVSIFMENDIYVEYAELDIDLLGDLIVQEETTDEIRELMSKFKSKDSSR